MTVTITAGHGGKDSGAVASDGTTEASIATEMRRLIVYYLDKAGISYRTDGVGFENQPLNQAVKLIKGSSLAIEIHTNSFHSASAQGVEALAQSKDKHICQQLCQAVSQVMQIPTRGTESGYKSENSGQHHRLAYVRNGGIILELFFISNPSELEKYRAKKWLIAKAIADVIIQYVNKGA